MSNFISDKIRLLGLIVKTKPYTYTNNNVMCDFSSYIEVSELVQLKAEIETNFNNMQEEEKTDAIRSQFFDDIYFLDTVIQELNSKV